MINPCNVRLSAYGGLPLKTLGCCSLKCKNKNIYQNRNYHIMETDLSAILGLRQSLDFGVFYKHMSANLTTHHDHAPTQSTTKLRQKADTVSVERQFQWDREISRKVLHPCRSKGATCCTPLLGKYHWPYIKSYQMN